MDLAHFNVQDISKSNEIDDKQIPMGLKILSLRVKWIVENQHTTSYKEVAEILV